MKKNYFQSTNAFTEYEKLILAIIKMKIFNIIYKESYNFKLNCKIHERHECDIYEIIENMYKDKRRIEKQSNIFRKEIQNINLIDKNEYKKK